MSTVFELIIAGDIPGKFVWADDTVVAFATIEPVAPGHTLVVPREPVTKWTELPGETWFRLARVAQIIGAAAERAFEVPRAALLIAGFEVPHTHIHVIPARSEKDCSLAGATKASESELTQAMEALRAELRSGGHAEHVPTGLESL